VEDDDTTLIQLIAVLDILSHIARMMHPRRLTQLIAQIGNRDAALGVALNGLDPDSPIDRQIEIAATLASRTCAGLRTAPAADNPMLEAYRAMRHYSGALEALAALAELVPAVSRYFLEPRLRDDPVLRRRLAGAAHPDSGIYHLSNETTQRGGFSVYVPPLYDAMIPAPVIVALHGGSGHGRQFLWNWLPEARSRGIIVVAPTASGSTWSLMEPEIDSHNLRKILSQVRERWNVDPSHMLLTGMSDGGTFTLLNGLSEDSPFTHLAPVAASFHPLLLAMSSPRRLAGLPIHLTHGALDWMFPVSMARTAHRSLAEAGAAVIYREIADLSHAYPRDGQTEVLDWWLPATSPSAPRL
jgi:phospholipase/carboxylesterase